MTALILLYNSPLSSSARSTASVSLALSIDSKIISIYRFFDENGLNESFKDGKCYFNADELKDEGSVFTINFLKEGFAPLKGSPASGSVSNIFSQSLVFFVKSFNDNDCEVVFNLDVNTAFGFDNGLKGYVNWDMMLFRNALNPIRASYSGMFHEKYGVSLEDYGDLKNQIRCPV